MLLSVTYTRIVLLSIDRRSPDLAVPTQTKGRFTSLFSTHLTSSDLVSTDLVSSEVSVLWLVAATAIRVSSRRTTQFAVAATNHSVLSSDDMRSAEIR